MGPQAVAGRPWCAVQADCGGCAQEVHLVGWVQAATGWAAAAIFGENPCNRTFGSIVSAIGVVAAPWRRAIWERSVKAIYDFDDDRLMVSWIDGRERPADSDTGKREGVFIVYVRKEKFKP